MNAGRVARRLLPLVALLVAISPLFALSKAPTVPAAVQAKFKKYDSKYYVVFSDLDPERVQEAVSRVTSVGEEYWERMKGFGGKITMKWPFYFVGDRALYNAAGGQAMGVAYADRLLVIQQKGNESEMWFTMQHEMFHQFAVNVIGDKVAVWANEGMADYYGEATWTGDGLVSGTGTPGRRQYWMNKITTGGLPPFRQLLLKKANDWRGQDLYVQAWGMVYFLRHAENGKYVKSLDAYFKATAAGQPWDAAFTKCIGDPDAIQKSCEEWWKALPADSYDRYFAEATVGTLTSCLGRAWSQGQKFATAEEFLAAARDGSLKKHPKQPLPDELLKDALARADKLKTWSLDVPKTGLPKLVLALDDGTTLAATFTLKNNHVESMKVDVKTAKP